MNQQNTQMAQQPIINKHDELILVVPRQDLFAQTPAWSGLKEVDFNHYLALIQAKKSFLPRSIMETDPTYKQIIPYLVFMHDDKLFLMQRTAKATETRLQNKFSLGIGGHIRQEDLTTDSIYDWAQREFHEEVSYTDALTLEPLGILNDDSNPVGQVHVGFVFLLKGATNAISVKSELKSGILVSLEECGAYYPTMESWSQIVVDFLRSKNK